MRFAVLSTLLLSACSGPADHPPQLADTFPITRAQPDNPGNMWTLPDASDPCAVPEPILCPPDVSHVIQGPLCAQVSHLDAGEAPVILPNDCLCDNTCRCLVNWGWRMCGHDDPVIPGKFDPGVLTSCTDGPEVAITCE